MRLTAFSFAAATLLAIEPLSAQGSKPDFTPLEFLVGSCWAGTFPDGKQTDDHCFEWVFERKFVRDRHKVRGGAPYDGETLYWWDAAKNRLTYWYGGSQGLVVNGYVETKGDSLVFPSKYAGAEGEVELKAVWVRTGADSYRVMNSERGKDGWKPLWSMDLTRRRP
jgi:hypothetical protein